jgi:hypothetical protein
VEIFYAAGKHSRGGLPFLAQSEEPDLDAAAGSQQHRWQRLQSQRSMQELQVLSQIHEVLSPNRTAAEPVLEAGCDEAAGLERGTSTATGTGMAADALLQTIPEELDAAAGVSSAGLTQQLGTPVQRSSSAGMQDTCGASGSRCSSAKMSTDGGSSPSAWKLEQLRLGLEMEMGEDLLVRGWQPGWHCNQC